MRTHLLIASALALSVAATGAHALTIVNQDKAAHMLKVMPTGGKAHDLMVKAGGKAQTSCTHGCSLSLGGETATYDAKTKEIWIKGGKFAQK